MFIKASVESPNRFANIICCNYSSLNRCLMDSFASVNVEICGAFFAFICINNIFCFAINWWSYVVSISSDMRCDWECWNRSVWALIARIATWWAAAFPSSSRPMSSSRLISGHSLHRSLLRFGPCRSAAIGGSGNTSDSSGFSLIIVRWCLVRTVLIFGRSGL